MAGSFRLTPRSERGGPTPLPPRVLGIWGSLPPYLGGKRRLCPLIFRELDRAVPRRHWPELTFLDAFLGGGSVSLHAKAQGFQVTAVDIARRSVVVGEALIGNSRTRLSREDIVKALALRDGDLTPRAMPLVPSVFTENVGRSLDQLLTAADRTQHRAKAALFRLLAIRVAMLAHPMSQVRAGTAHRATEGAWESITPSCLKHYVDALRLDSPEALWRVAQKINAGVITGQGRAIQGDAFELLTSLQADIAYFDPPYPGTASYETEYKVIDQLLGDEVRPVSRFSVRDGAGMVDLLLERAAHIPVWLLSFGNAVATLPELEEKMARHGRATRALEIPYMHRASVATAEKKMSNREYLLIGVDPSSSLLDRLGVMPGAVTV